MSRGTSYPCRLCQSIIFLSILPLIIYSQSETLTTNDCNRNCTGQSTSQDCACNSQDNILKSGETCHQHHQRIGSYMSTRDPDWLEMCNSTLLIEKTNAGTITMYDLMRCYRPECTVNSYESMQSHEFGNRWLGTVTWYWCTGPNGSGIPGTLKRNMQGNECSLRASCQFEGTTYADGVLFQPQHKCGVCECLNGNVTCFDDFVPDVGGQLNTSQLNQLSDLLTKFFYFEKDNKDSILFNIRDIHYNSGTIRPETQTQILNEWFQHYDTDGNGCIELNHTEEISFHNHVYKFTSCKQFLNHVSEVIDVDNSGSITQTEWMNFFRHYSTVEPTEEIPQVPNASKRSVSEFRPRRSLQNRRKFYYVLS